MEYDLRIYEMKAGELDAFVSEWREHVLPLRRAAGFDVLGAWRTDDDRFVWFSVTTATSRKRTRRITSRRRARSSTPILRVIWRTPNTCGCTAFFSPR